MLYPIGIQSFEKIRQGGYVYVDKTDLIYKIAKTSQYYFLSRPRRFGKSLLLSTMEAYFRGRKELFDGLAVASLEKDWTEYPVLHLDLGGANYADMDALKEKLGRQLKDLESEYGVVRKYKTLPVRFETIIEAAYRKTGRQVVILVDEYDKPVIDNLDRPELRDEIREELRGFYGVMKSNDDIIRFGFLTGVTKIGKMSVFSDLNNLTDISIDREYSDICGISETDLNDCFAESVRELAEANGLSEEECRQKLAMMYDGYHFHPKAAGVYNPFSLLNTFKAKEFREYWFETGTPSFLVKVMRRTSYDVTRLSGDLVGSSLLTDVNTAFLNPVPLLYQSGYLTIKHYDPMIDLYTLGYPNEEVRTGMVRSLAANYLTPAEGTNSSFVIKFVKAVIADDMEQALTLMRAYLAGVSYRLSNKTERDVQTIFYLVFSLIGSFIKVEEESAHGRADVVITLPSVVYVMELKFDGSADAALRQIDEKGYLIPYTADGKRLVKVGVNYSSEERTITEWRIEG